jgi:hypothetical protein
MNEELNTRLFSFDELVNKSYINLLYFSQNLQESVEEFEDIRLDLECEDYNTPEEIQELVFIDTQLRYVYQNLKISIDALAHHEAKSFCRIKDSLICLN